MKNIIEFIKNPDNDSGYKIFLANGDIYKEFSEKKGGTQIRKFYDIVVKINEKSKDVKTAKAQLSMVMPIAYYSKERKSEGAPLLDEQFYCFIKESIDALMPYDGEKFSNGLKAFREVFQAVIAYTKK